MRRHQAFLSRARAEADIAKAHFEADMKRRQAFFEESAAHTARRGAAAAERLLVVIARIRPARCC